MHASKIIETAKAYGVTRVGVTQANILNSLYDHKSWSRSAGWNWTSTGETQRHMERLEARGLVVSDIENRPHRGPGGRSYNVQIFRVSALGSAIMEEVLAPIEAERRAERKRRAHARAIDAAKRASADEVARELMALLGVTSLHERSQLRVAVANLREAATHIANSAEYVG